MNLIRKFLNWLSPSEPAYYYSMKGNELTKVTVADGEAVVEKVSDEEEMVDLPLFTTDELKEMTKSDLLELATDSGIADVTKKDTKKVLIEKIVSHYQIQQ